MRRVLKRPASTARALFRSVSPTRCENSAVPPFRAIHFRPRFNVQFLANGSLTLTQDGEAWTKNFETLPEALQGFRLLNPDHNARLTFYDRNGIEMNHSAD